MDRRAATSEGVSSTCHQHLPPATARPQMLRSIINCRAGVVLRAALWAVSRAERLRPQAPSGRGFSSILKCALFPPCRPTVQRACDAIKALAGGFALYTIELDCCPGVLTDRADRPSDCAKWIVILFDSCPCPLGVTDLTAYGGISPTFEARINILASFFL